jgi:2-oxoisovalerate dehydrogenase E1 component beta subunit
MVVRAPYGGGVHGALYHSQSIEAFYGHVPGLKVVVPSTPHDVKGMLRAAIRDPDPVLFLEHKKTYRLIKGEVPDEPFEVPIGSAEVKREGDDLTVIAYGLMLHHCLEAAERLAQEEGASVEVVDVRTIAPLDRETILASVRKTGKAMVVYEDNFTYGAGAEISATISEECLFDLDAPVVRMGGPDIPAMPFSGNLEHFYMPDADKIHARMRELYRF